jgi:hypothetical protein
MHWADFSKGTKFCSVARKKKYIYSMYWKGTRYLEFKSAAKLPITSM